MGKGLLFHAEFWENYPSGHHLLCFVAKGKLAKEMAKDLEREKCIFGILFVKIKEIRRKWRWKVTGYMWGVEWRKIMENG